MKTITILILSFSINFLYSQQGWVQQVSGINSTLNCVYFFDGNTGWVGGDGGVALKTTNGGTNWFSLNTGSSRLFYSIQFVNQNTGFIGTGYDKVFRTTNSGTSWDTTIGGGGYSVFFVNGTTGYSARQGTQYSLWKTTNTGLTWDSVGALPSIIGPVNDIFFIDASVGFICGNHFAFSAQTYDPYINKTTSGGISWGAGGYSAPSSHYVPSSITDLYFVNNIGFAIGFEAPSTTTPYFYKSTNQGQNWVKTVMAQTMASITFVDNNTGWICGPNGKIMYSTNGSSTWFDQTSPVSATLRQIYMVNNNTGYIVGTNGTILKTTNGGITALQQTGTAVPDNFTLSQNYPNPFNPVTLISFDIPISSFVNITVYDASGKEITSLVNQQLSAGSYSVDWNATAYPSGVYFYRITAGEYIETKKMVLIK